MHHVLPDWSSTTNPTPRAIWHGNWKSTKTKGNSVLYQFDRRWHRGKKKKKRKKNKYRQKFGQRESIAAENVTGLGTKSTATKGQVSATKDESRLSNLYWTSQENITVKFNRIIQRENVVSHLSPSTPTIAALWKDSDGNLCVKAKGRNCCWFCLTFEPRDVGTSEIMHQKCSPRL